jgi:mannose-6-phosphate isomerase-like protein (cupin superfamily)
MKPFIGSLEKLTVANEDFRRVLFTGRNEQLVLMCLGPGEEIGREIHAVVDQFFRIEEGNARFLFGSSEEQLVPAGSAFLVPAGTFHNVINASNRMPLKLYTIYSPPQHPEGTVHRTKHEAMAAEHH